jgi:signal transduction histidine kinase
VKRLPLRIRLTLVFAAATAVVLAGAAALVYVRVGGDLDRALDDQLRARSQDLAALVRRGGSLDATRGELVESGESFAELVGTDGRVVDSTAPIGRRLLVSRGQLARARGGPVFVDRPSAPGLDEPARLLASPLGRRVLVVGVTRENRAEILHSLRAAFLIGGPLALLLTSLAGYVLAGAALRPIEAMRARAAEISTSSLDERLPVSDANDEVARLGATLNEMLERLEDGVARERRFVADASHELRTPLALLKTELEVALRGRRSPVELEEAIRSAAATTDRLSRIADDLLVLARADRGRLVVDPEPTDVLDVLASVARRFEPAADADARSVDVEAGEALVADVDRMRVEQALTNMVDNALRHGGGAVTLAARRENGSLELHVLDEGGGFPDGFVAHAFEPFSRAEEARSGDGAGLGLAIVDAIARAHGGRAAAANRPGGGADVSIAVPLT